LLLLDGEKVALALGKETVTSCRRARHTCGLKLDVIHTHLCEQLASERATIRLCCSYTAAISACQAQQQQQQQQQAIRPFILLRTKFPPSPRRPDARRSSWNAGFVVNEEKFRCFHEKQSFTVTSVFMWHFNKWRA